LGSDLVGGRVDSADKFELVALKVLVVFSLVGEGVVGEVSSEDDSDVAVLYGSFSKVEGVWFELEGGPLLCVFAFELIKLELYFAT
jgi:hypothetical protein